MKKVEILQSWDFQKDFSIEWISSKKADFQIIIINLISSVKTDSMQRRLSSVFRNY